MRIKCLITLVLVLCVLTGTAFAGELKDRMVARRPAVNALLADGTVGENNKGYLEFRGVKKQADVVAAENQDRAAVYQFIAKKTGTTTDLVGQRRAAHVAESAQVGTWLQKPDGTWYQK